MVFGPVNKHSKEVSLWKNKDPDEGPCASKSTRRREQMTTTRIAIVAVVCGILGIFLLEVLAVLAWA
jgi:hypothetical protein